MSDRRYEPADGAPLGPGSLLWEVIEGRRHWAGRLLSVEDGAVSLALEKEGGAVARVPLEKIAHGRLEVEFK